MGFFPAADDGGTLLAEEEMHAFVVGHMVVAGDCSRFIILFGLHYLGAIQEE